MVTGEGMDDSQEIANLVYSYAERLDSGDFAGVAELFSDATFRAVVGDELDVHRGSRDVQRVLDRLVATYEDGTPKTKHVTTNLIIEVVTSRAGAYATCRSYFSVLQGMKGFPLQVVIAGRYHDAFEKVERGWRFTDRLVLSDIMGDLSRHLKSNPF